MTGDSRAALGGTDRPLAETYDTALLDLDGVVYVGPDPVPHAAEALGRARELGMRLAYVTNNASRTCTAVAAHLSELGVPATPDQVVTSAQAAARLIAEQVPPGAAVLVVGGEGLREALREHGLVPVDSADDGPAAVAQGFAPDLSWAQLAEGAVAVGRGLPWVAANADLTLPTPRGLAPGNGALVATIATTTGRQPVVAGKPQLPLHREALLRSGGRRPLVVGDRLDTDIEGANRASTDSLLVLTGVTDVATLLAAPLLLRPRYLARDLRGLLEPQPAPRRVSGGWACGGWTCGDDDENLRLRGDGDPLDALRAAAEAAWGLPARVDRAPLVRHLEQLLSAAAAVPSSEAAAG